MSDIKLFRFSGNSALEIRGTASDLEKPLQSLIEINLEVLFGIRLLESEHPTGKKHGGRIDTLGLDENDCPVIIEYKRSVGENVINQGLFYLDWLMDHRAEFKLLTLEKFGKEAADKIDWTSPRLLCIAADFTKYDAHAVQQIDWSVELIRYRRFGSDLLLFELVNAVTPEVPKSLGKAQTAAASKAATAFEPRPRWLPTLPAELATLFQSLKAYVESLGDDVQQKNLKLYVAFKRLRNFVTIVGSQKALVLYLHLDPASVTLVSEFTRDVRKIGHWGTGDLEVVLTSLADLNKAKLLIARAYEST